ncbi:hypothetical protein [Leptospira kanakyensis]|uniref:hypothetical protein n=1 Tax=Leptospira kanakyensis TaxID=2484968 RepID=UPI00223E38D3|nr:hypothetical protein [Leptospira kanakyensis]MCW7483262.1 hypothetical protein [Leptospira kanakyensis]
MKCYANSLGNCSAKFSREHIISDALLESKVGVSGFEWCKGEEVFIGKGSFTQKILCAKHNSALSPYDSEMTKLFKILNEYNGQSILGEIGYKEGTIQGELLERWVLKTSINFIHYYSNEEKVIFQEDTVIPYLFEEKLFSFPFGLSISISTKLNANFEGKTHFQIGSTTIGENRYLDTAILIFRGLMFIFYLPTKTNLDQIDLLKLKCSGTNISNKGFLNLWHFNEINHGRNKIKITWKNKQFINR